ncbi:hypothetical protein [Dysosmobacter sp.]|nr:hypothetical protein [Dysosmobacter sp.]
MSKIKNGIYEKASRGVRPACALTMDEVFHGGVHVWQLANPF